MMVAIKWNWFYLWCVFAIWALLLLYVFCFAISQQYSDMDRNMCMWTVQWYWNRKVNRQYIYRMVMVGGGTYIVQPRILSLCACMSVLSLLLLLFCAINFACVCLGISFFRTRFVASAFFAHIQWNTING